MKSFESYLNNIKYPKKKTSWNISGTIKDHNGFYKFDTKPLNKNAKGGSFKTKADKIVYDINNQYIIVDVEELHNYLLNNNLKVVHLEELLSKLEWNIILPK